MVSFLTATILRTKSYFLEQNVYKLRFLLLQDFFFVFVFFVMVISLFVIVKDNFVECCVFFYFLKFLKKLNNLLTNVGRYTSINYK